jgi:hypothetical protein
MPLPTLVPRLRASLALLVLPAMAGLATAALGAELQLRYEGVADLALRTGAELPAGLKRVTVDLTIDEEYLRFNVQYRINGHCFGTCGGDGKQALLLQVSDGLHTYSLPKDKVSVRFEFDPYGNITAWAIEAEAQRSKSDYSQLQTSSSANGDCKAGFDRVAGRFQPPATGGALSRIWKGTPEAKDYVALACGRGVWSGAPKRPDPIESMTAEEERRYALMPLSELLSLAAPEEGKVDRAIALATRARPEVATLHGIMSLPPLSALNSRLKHAEELMPGFRGIMFGRSMDLRMLSFDVAMMVEEVSKDPEASKLLSQVQESLANAGELTRRGSFGDLSALRRIYVLGKKVHAMPTLVQAGRVGKELSFASQMLDQQAREPSTSPDIKAKAFTASFLLRPGRP